MGKRFDVDTPIAEGRPIENKKTENHTALIQAYMNITWFEDNCSIRAAAFARAV